MLNDICSSNELLHTSLWNLFIGHLMTRDSRFAQELHGAKRVKDRIRSASLADIGTDKQLDKDLEQRILRLRSGAISHCFLKDSGSTAANVAPRDAVCVVIDCAHLHSPCHLTSLWPW